jgi:hypothetical protein
MKLTGTHSTLPVWIVTGTIIILPRLLRLMASVVHIEDPNYMYGAFLILKGMVPFADFAQVNPPLLESVIAGLYYIFGITYRVPEVLTAVACAGTAVILVRLGGRFHSKIAGITAASIYSWHFLVFRYHVFEREIYATLAVFAALDLMTRKKADGWSPFSAGLLMGLGFVCKQTALIPVAAILLVMTLLRGQWRRAILVFCGFTFFTGLVSAGYSLVFGWLYWDQIFWFHLIKGYVAPWFVKAFWTWAELGFLAPLAISGLWLLKKSRRDWNWLWPTMILADLIFFWLVSGAFWPHYLLSILPPASLLAGMTAAESSVFFKRKIRKTDPSVPKIRHEHVVTAWPVLLSLVTVLTGVLAAQIFLPDGISGSGSTEQFGFSGVPRMDVRAAGQAIRDNTAEDDWIISDPFIGLEAQRIKVVRFKDNWGLILWMQQMMERGEYRSAVRKLSKKPFGDIRMTSHRYWMPLIETAFAMGRVGAVQPNYELPLDESYLRSQDMQIVYQSDHYTIWAKTHRSSSK